MVSCGDWHTLALEESGQVWAWGGGMGTHNRGQCGAGNIAVLEKPHLLSFFADKQVTQVAAGGLHSIAVVNDCIMYGWGCGEKGQNGLGDFVDTAHPKRCVPYWKTAKQVKFKKGEQLNISQEPEDKIIQIRAGGHHTMILLESGTVYSFGYAALG